ncbi:MAG: hypothetical protein ABRQ23_04425 [Syntrophomonadaceae bacterium]
MGDEMPLKGDENWVGFLSRRSVRGGGFNFSLIQVILLSNQTKRIGVEQL